ncbi:MAG: LysM peptidoglycan-binding domain-containing protein [Anaerolineae bacterium]|nr:LysM peptidoglycan-binding domain-containing protein [Anaerolineae bacterium]MDH7475396.1 LysM peptidoglycan-binding domain-containing protein [Anaerolineae bacterium]
MKRWKTIVQFVIGLLLASSLLVTGRGVVAAPPLQEPVIHVVQAGETLFSIAQKYGTTVEAIVAANGLSNPDLIFAGQKLIIPTGETAETLLSVIVQPGDTLALLACRYNTTVQAIAERNRLINPALIRVGQSLSILTLGPPPEHTQMHIVQSEDTLVQVAWRYGVGFWTLAQVNGLRNPNIISTGQCLSIPLDRASEELPLPFSAVEKMPSPVVQGQTLVIKVHTSRPATVSGTFDEQLLTFVPQMGQDSTYWALAGVDAMARPGSYDLYLTAHDEAGGVTTVIESVPVGAGNFEVQNIYLSPEVSALLDPMLVRDEQLRVADVMDDFAPSPAWTGLFQVPLRGEINISSPFGGRRSYNGGLADSYHGGVDLEADAGTPVYAAATGRVALAESLRVRGNAVILDHGMGVYTGYWHLSGIAVQAGQTVLAGDLIGYVGSTGLSTAPHLHWELRVNNVQVDPWQWTQQIIP